MTDLKRIGLLKRIPVRYALVGGASAAIDWILFFSLVFLFETPYLVAGTISFICATVSGYFLTTFFVFQSGSRFSRSQEVTVVFLVSGCGLVFNQLILWGTAVQLNWPLLLCKFIATSSVFVWNYYARAKFIFRESATR